MILRHFLIVGCLLLERCFSINLLSFRDGGTVIPAIPAKLETHEDSWLAKIRQSGHHSNVTTGFSVDLSLGGRLTRVRPWTRAHLSRAVLVDNPQQFGPMLARLNSREPVHVLAYGSSITQDLGGCFHTGPVQALAERIGADRLPDNSNLYRSVGDRGGVECGQREPMWGNMFMQVVNATWPHPGHALINAGIAACNLDCPYHRGCMEQELPGHLDLVVMEAVTPTQGEMLERLLSRIFTFYTREGKPRPAVVYIRSGFIVGHERHPETDTCLRDASRCESTCAAGFNHTLTPDMLHTGVDEPALSVVRHYRLTALSHRAFLTSMLQDGIPQQLLAARKDVLQAAGDTTWGDMSACRFLSAIHADPIHLDPMGRLLYADYLLNVLVGAQTFWSGAGGGNVGARHVPELPKSPLHTSGWTVEQAKCTALVDARGPGGTRELMPWEDVVLVTGAEGFNFSEYTVHGSRRRYKPGWVATTPGASLTLVLCTVFWDAVQRQPQLEPGEATVVAVSYLESYEHMGTLRASCVSGCKCEPVTVSAHQPGVRASVIRTVELPTRPPSYKCVLRLEVLQTSGSGEHKFKVLGVTAKKLAPRGQHTGSGKQYGSAAAAGGHALALQQGGKGVSIADVAHAVWRMGASSQLLSSAVGMVAAVGTFCGCMAWRRGGQGTGAMSWPPSLV